MHVGVNFDALPTWKWFRMGRKKVYIWHLPDLTMYLRPLNWTFGSARSWLHIPHRSSFWRVRGLWVLPFNWARRSTVCQHPTLYVLSLDHHESIGRLQFKAGRYCVMNPVLNTMFLNAIFSINHFPCICLCDRVIYMKCFGLSQHISIIFLQRYVCRVHLLSASLYNTNICLSNRLPSNPKNSLHLM